jgi:predicted metal-dependent hydrolase
MRRPIPKKPLSMVDLSTITKMTLSIAEKELLANGITLFNSGEFWKAHEVWEEIWQSHPEDGRFFVQGLIQLAAAYHQLLRGISRGFEIHIKNAWARLRLFPAEFLGINVESLLKEIEKQISVIEAEKWPPEASSVELPAPCIHLSTIQGPGFE